jgi:hypothetical protein
MKSLFLRNIRAIYLAVFLQFHLISFPHFPYTSLSNSKKKKKKKEEDKEVRVGNLRFQLLD